MLPFGTIGANQEMTTGQWLAIHRPIMPFADALFRNKAVHLQRVGTSLHVQADPNRCPTEFRPVLAHMAPLFVAGAASGVECYTLLQLAYEGVRMFRPTLDDCLALEDIEINIGVGDYAQPFPTFCIEFPPEYTKLRTLSGSDTHDRMVEYGPVLGVIHHDMDVQAILCKVLTTRALCLCGIVGSPESGLLEEDLKKKLKFSATYSDEEAELNARVMRICLNTCLMLLDRGHRLSGYGTSEKHVQRVKSFIEKNKRRQDRQKLTNAIHDLKIIPHVYTFQQVINIRKAIGGDGTSTRREGGYQVGPHWVGAHWKMVPYGPKSQLRKRKLIKRYMVHKELFQGQEADTTVIYEKPN